MFLKALEIQGFKSFPDKTRISFDKGITAVVGPNGSGKSNISDAVRWVLGETSAKQLRGGGKMENVIFGGTQGRNAMGYSSVQLILDNGDRRFDMDADEAVIGRKYYRSGESEYSINGQSVRLKDVYELLLDTGLGRDGYSVIGQGRIAEIVGAKSAERREIFEEASGISRYRYRKNDAERKLAATEENLIRLRDILAELQPRVEQLEKESAKARRFLELSDERKALEVTLWVDTVRATREDLRAQQRKIEIAEADNKNKEQALEKLEAGTEALHQEREQQNIIIDTANRSLIALQEEIGESNSSVVEYKTNITRNEQEIERLVEEISQSGKTAGEISAQIEKNNGDIEEVERALAATREKIAGLESQLEEIQAKSLATGERRGQLEATLADLTDRITSNRVNAASAESSAASAEGRIGDVTSRLEAAEAEQKRLTGEKEEMDTILNTAAGDAQRLENIKGGLEMKLESRQKGLADAQEAERGLVRETENTQHRIQMLKDLERSLDGFQSSVKSIIKAGREGKLRGIIGPVSTILTVKPGYELALETALGYSLQNIVVDGEAAAKAAMAFLKQTKGGRATFLPLDTVKGQKFDASRLPEGAISAQSTVKYDPKYENIVSSLLARIVVVEDINEASRVARSLEYRNRVVTRDGQVINAGGSFTGGSTSRSTGLFSRKQEIDDLGVKLAGLEGKGREAAEATAKVKAEVDALVAELRATEAEIITAGEDKIRAESELTRIGNALAAAAEQQKQLRRECDELAEQNAQAAAERKLAENEQQRLSGEIAALEEELRGIEGEGDGFLSGREALQEQLQEFKMTGLGQENEIKMLHQQNETLQSRTGENDARREALEAKIEQMKAQNAEYAGKIENAGSRTGEIRNRMTELEEEIRQASATRIELEGRENSQKKEEQAINEERIELGREISRLTEQKAALESRCDNTISQLWDEYQLGLSEAEKLCVEFTSVADLRRKVQELRGKIKALGNVNVGAIEEYEEQGERYRFLSTQVSDVEESKANLEKMIEELCSEMTSLFAASFGLINDNFSEIFVELFGGGRARLSLSDPNNLLESGIDIEVAPPGKVIKDLTALSGGEQALVAICIYFAILAVNPAPFCVLDEIEAALDDVNVVRFARYLRGITHNTQFIVITHRRGTMEEADVLYGVTMQEDGVSKILRLNLADVDVS